MDIFSDILAFPFMQHALIAIFLSSIACGIIGTLVIFNRLVFLAGGASHAAYGGIGIAVFFSLPFLPCTIIFTLLASLFMASMTFKGKSIDSAAGQETAIGVLWSAGTAVGIILVQLTPGYSGELNAFLFGSVLAVPVTDLYIMAAFDAFLIVLVFLFRQGFWAISLDRDFAGARGLPIKFLYLLMVGLSAIAVVLLIRVVGLILVLALFIIPPYIARIYCKRFYTTMFASCILSLIFCFGGLMLSSNTNIVPGAAIIAIASIVYFVSAIPGHFKAYKQ